MAVKVITEKSAWVGTPLYIVDGLLAGSNVKTALPLEHPTRLPRQEDFTLYVHCYVAGQKTVRNLCFRKVVRTTGKMRHGRAAVAGSGGQCSGFPADCVAGIDLL